MRKGTWPWDNHEAVESFLDQSLDSILRANKDLEWCQWWWMIYNPLWRLTPLCETFNNNNNINIDEIDTCFESNDIPTISKIIKIWSNI